MDCIDFNESRIQLAKAAIQKIILRFPNERVGLIVFAGNAYLQCPLTQDHDVFFHYLNLANSSQFTDKGTNFRKAFLKLIEVRHKDDSKLSAFALLFSDGESSDKNYQSLVERCKKMKILILPIGVGSEKGAYIPIGSDSLEKIYLKNEKNQIITSSLNKKNLFDIAKNFDINLLLIDNKIDKKIENDLLSTIDKFYYNYNYFIINYYFIVILIICIIPLFYYLL
jgi:Ca-activated chloride channel family protein